MLPSRQEIRKRVLVRVLGHPFTVWPVVFAAGSGMFALFSHDPAIPLFTAIGAFLVGTGMAGYNLIFRTEQIVQETVSNLQDAQQQAVAERLDDLRHRLSQDHDDRDERALDDLRALASAFQGEDSILSQLDVSTAMDIRTGVNRLFEQCVQALEGTLKNQTLISKLSAEAAAPLRERRERVIEQVQSAVRELGNILAGAQKLVARRAASDGSANAIDGETDELRRSLELAETVEVRMRGFESSGHYNEYLRS
ncbi:MAG: hypothetical protein UT30_C0002G0058 [Candidatus Uhrbacteria bacterium GW2011_GWF2_39_13]|uniref:Uncharacterized protein n=1 Tax=Candidatus Uhrbacteria bacterium GW2011_GWF2_39_13 TaxID=1618995 RepID=A0A0G0MWW9_9BACT|nr:MAG: hypothetical protein UT30_C0002G0058 [Candidatus Uhrbacteria bacterium GW2011_GWF2_39_13]HAU66146.1 hypothetical protein [Candidatus Uhrbacteria bacterium]